MFSGFASSRSSLSPQQALKLANVYLVCARNEEDPDVSLILCHDTEISLSQAKKAVSRRAEDHDAVVQGIAAAYVTLSALLEKRGRSNEAKAINKKASKLG